MTRRLRSIALLALAATSLAAAAACTSPATKVTGRYPKPASVAATCDYGTFTYSDIRTADVLTGMTGIIVVKKAGPVSATTPVQQVARAEAYVTASAQVPRAVAYDDLVGKAGGQALPLGTFRDGSRAVEGLDRISPGRFIFFSGVRTVSGTFDYECGGVSYGGSTTVLLMDEDGVVDCPPSKPAMNALVQQVLDRGCPSTAVSAKPSAKPGPEPSK